LDWIDLTEKKDVACLCEDGNELWYSIKGGEFLDQLSDYQILKDDSAPWSYCDYEPLRWYPTASPHGVTAQKAPT